MGLFTVLLLLIRIFKNILSVLLILHTNYNLYRPVSLLQWWLCAYIQAGTYILTMYLYTCIYVPDTSHTKSVMVTHPMVLSNADLNESLTNLRTMLDFPTPDSCTHRKSPSIHTIGS